MANLTKQSSPLLRATRLLALRAQDVVMYRDYPRQTELQAYKIGSIDVAWRKQEEGEEDVRYGKPQSIHFPPQT